MEVSNAPFSSKQCVVNLFRVPGLRQRSNNDEEPARTNKDRFNMPSYPPYNTTPFYPSGQRFVPSNPVFWHNFLFCLSYWIILICVTCRICGGCNCEILSGHYLTCIGTFWHPRCFRCHSCHEPITEPEVWYHEKRNTFLLLLIFLHRNIICHVVLYFLFYFAVCEISIVFLVSFSHILFLFLSFLCQEVTHTTSLVTENCIIPNVMSAINL